MNGQQGRTHDTYARFTGHGDDMVGLIAYCLYKRHKIEYLDGIRARHGREPTEAERTSFFDTITDSLIANFRERAVGIVQDFVDAAVAREFAESRARLIDEQRQTVELAIQSVDTKLADLARRERPGFMYGVWQGFWGTVLFLTFLFGATVLLHQARVDVAGWIIDAANRAVETPQTPSAPTASPAP